MGRNNYREHLLVIFEDQAYKDYYLGFANHALFNDSQIYDGDIFGGWTKIQEQVNDENSVTLEHLSRFENAYVLALLDCDKDINRIDSIRRKIPNIYQDRIFFLSSFDEAEHLKDDLGQGKKETIGYQLAQHCYDNDSSLWKVPMLNHNLPEIEKLKIKFKFFS